MALVFSALESFGHYGFEAASTREICERCRQNVAAISYHFGSKENLYLAVADFLAHAIAESVADVLEPTWAYLAGAERSVAQTERHLANLLRSTVRSVYANVQSAAPALFIMREQASPTAAFEVLFDKLLRPMHETITELVADRIGIAPDGLEATLRAHAIVGQMLGFKAGKATVQKRTGWASADDPGPENVELIADIVVEQTLGALQAVAKRRGAK